MVRSFWALASRKALDGPDDGFEIVRDRDGPIRVRCSLHAAPAQSFFERLRVAAMVRDGCRGILQRVPGEDANDPLASADDSLSAQRSGASDTGGRRRLAPQAAASDLCLGIQDFLIRDFANHASAVVERRSALSRFTGRLISIALAIVAARAPRESSPA